MYGVTQTTVDADRTAFRRAEKKYKLYKSQNPKSRKKQSHIETDLSDVVDFRDVLESFKQSGDTPGFYFIPGALTVGKQAHWIRESLKTFPQPPNRTNHNAMYGPIYDLFNSARCNKFLVEAESEAAEPEPTHSCGGNYKKGYIFSDATHKEESCKPIAASVLLRKLRWSTLGLQFNWSKRNYDVSLPHEKIPADLCLLAKKMAIPAIPPGEEFQPEAAIVNYFGPSDMLGGHLDDMEADWSKPIVSISLGCKAIFLLGGKSREDLPTAMFLRSGDIVLMAGQARECFHGIPRIFTDQDNAEVSSLLQEFSDEQDVYFRDYMKSSRININIRQVN